MKPDRALLDQLPDGTLVPVEWVRLLLDAEPAGDGDLTVAEAGKVLGRSPSSVRTWCAKGELEAYRLRGREWRITRAAIDAFQEREREAHATQANGKTASRATGRKATLSEWRKVREKADT